MIGSEEGLLAIFIHSIVFAFIMVTLMQFWKKLVKIPVIWIIDDSLEDQSLMLRSLEGKRYKVKCFSSPKGLHVQMAMNKPAAVIADYKLSGYTIDGDRVFKFCARHHIPVTIVTGYDGEIKDIDPSMIIKKSTPNFYKDLHNWLSSVVK